jgi:hypothetical protein
MANTSRPPSARREYIFIDVTFQVAALRHDVVSLEPTADPHGRPAKKQQGR